jgi:hypothetical protein
VQRAEVRADGSIILDFNDPSPTAVATDANPWDAVK